MYPERRGGAQRSKEILQVEQRSKVVIVPTKPFCLDLGMTLTGRKSPSFVSLRSISE